MAESNSSNMVRVVVEVSGVGGESAPGGTPAAAPVTTPVATLAPMTARTLGSNSPAWHHDSHAVGALFFEAHKADSNDESRRVLSELFKALCDSTGDYNNLRKFQRLLGKFDPATQGTLAPLDMEAVAGAVAGDTVVTRLNRWVGSVLNPKVPEAPLTHAQYVLFWHLLRDQEDLKLISPFDTSTLPW